jgi:hypothetical protein
MVTPAPIRLSPVEASVIVPLTVCLGLAKTEIEATNRIIRNKFFIDITNTNWFLLIKIQK